MPPSNDENVQNTLNNMFNSMSEDQRQRLFDLAVRNGNAAYFYTPSLELQIIEHPPEEANPPLPGGE